MASAIEDCAGVLGTISQASSRSSFVFAVMGFVPRETARHVPSRHTVGANPRRLSTLAISAI
jgi:hypothetical protein